MPDYEKYSDNYDIIFGKKKNEPVQDSFSTQCPVAEMGDSGEETLPKT
jgi:hypothetical protein